MSDQVVTHDLRSGWTFKQTDDYGSDAWMAVEKVPTCVHLDLMANKKIPDPFLGFNELDVEWVGQKSWTYKTSLPPAPSSKDGLVTYLAFDGLDTFATVKLNGKVILESDNMFVPHRVDVTKLLQAGGENVLEIDFASALLRARELMTEHPDHKYLVWNGEPARLTTRKAQYHWGWDWGPVLMTAGPWKSIRLETYCARIVDLWAEYRVSSDFDYVSGTIFVEVEGKEEESSVDFSVGLGRNEIMKGRSKIGADGIAKLDFEIKDAKLWFPHGYGTQSLYNFSANLLLCGAKVDTMTKKIGLRHVDLVQKSDHIGKTFYFRINGVDIFCGGSDWIPADSFIPRISEERYRKWLELMVDGNQVMIRVWGGGIWEEDPFYNICDELGIMIWHDFMFGCGNYPTWPSLLASIETESTSQVKRLRHHCSLTVWAGNNEDYQLQEQAGLTYDYADKNPGNWLKTDFPARYIYEKILPSVVAAHSPSVPYHPGSPWGDGKITSDQTVGDMHQWNVWHGTQEKYQIFDTLGGRFNSEFGMEAFPHIDTIKAYCTDETQLYPQSHMLDFHNKADGHERRIATYLVENFRTKTDLAAFIHLTQLVQSEALMFGYRGWRKRWGQQRFCGGALVWQLNDCWPVTSWAIVDYYLRKKPAYYAMARVLAPVAVGVQRAHHDWSVCHARPAKESKYELWVVSSKLAEFKADVELRFISIQSGKDIKEPVLKKEVAITPNGTTDILAGAIDNVSEEPHVLAARVFMDGNFVARDVDWPQPLKYLSFEDRGVEVRKEGEGELVVTARKPTKGLVFEERKGVLLSDSALDVVPGDEVRVKVRGLNGADRELGWTYLGKDD